MIDWPAICKVGYWVIVTFIIIGVLIEIKAFIERVTEEK